MGFSVIGLLEHLYLIEIYLRGKSKSYLRWCSENIHSISMNCRHVTDQFFGTNSPTNLHGEKMISH